MNAETEQPQSEEVETEAVETVDTTEAGNESGDTPAAEDGQDGDAESGTYEIDDRPIAVAQQTMVGDLRDVCLQIMRDPKTTGKAWKDMSEAEQRDTAQRITDRVEDAVIQGVRIISANGQRQIISANGQRQIIATLEQVVIKDGVKAVLKCSKHDELLHSLVDAEGDAVAIVLTGAEDYVGAGEKVKFDKDQPELPVDDAEETETAEDETHDEEGQEESVDEETGEITEAGEDEGDREVEALEKESDELT